MYVCFWRDSPQWARASSFTRFLNHTQRRTTVGKTPLDEWSARRRELYQTTHITHNRQTSHVPSGILTHSPSKRAATELRPRGHWDGNIMDICQASRSWSLCLSPSKKGNWNIFIEGLVIYYYAVHWSCLTWPEFWKEQKSAVSVSPPCNRWGG
jgi:hypothetical protein